MKYSVVLIGTNIENRFMNLCNVAYKINRLNAIAGYPITKKILSVDEFGPTCKKMEDYLHSTFSCFEGWQVISKPRRGMVQSQRDALKEVETDWILYLEDDILVERLLTAEELGREDVEGFGILSYMGGGYDLEKYTSDIDICLRKPCYYKERDSYQVWIREPKFTNNYWVEFPATMIKTDLLRKCHDVAAKDKQIENGLTAAWFELGLDKQYDKGTLLKKHTRPTDNLTYQDIKSYFCGELLFSEMLPSYSIGGGYHF